MLLNIHNFNSKFSLLITTFLKPYFSYFPILGEVLPSHNSQFYALSKYLISIYFDQQISNISLQFPEIPSFHHAPPVLHNSHNKRSDFASALSIFQRQMLRFSINNTHFFQTNIHIFYQHHSFLTKNPYFLYLHYSHPSRKVNS